LRFIVPHITFDYVRINHISLSLQCQASQSAGLVTRLVAPSIHRLWNEPWSHNDVQSHHLA